MDIFYVLGLTAGTPEEDCCVVVVAGTMSLNCVLFAMRAECMIVMSMLSGVTMSLHV